MQQGGCVQTSLASLSQARNEKGPMSSRNLYYTLSQEHSLPDLEEVVIKAIRNNAKTYLNPPIKNIAFKGIDTASRDIVRWFDASKNIEEEFGTSALLMERAGTGGALFRNIYRDFLKEAYDLTGIEQIHNAYEQFIVIAERWTEIASIFDSLKSIEDRDKIIEASILMKRLSIDENKVFCTLLDL